MKLCALINEDAKVIQHCDHFIVDINTAKHKEMVQEVNKKFLIQVIERRRSQREIDGFVVIEDLYMKIKVFK